MNGTIYTAVEKPGCGGCDLNHTPACLKTTCGRVTRKDGRDVIWKCTTTDIQNKSSSEHTKPIDIKVVNENKIIMDDVEYQPIDKNGCTGCAFRGVICYKYGKSIPCMEIERKDRRRVIWKKVSDKQIHVSLLETRQAKTYKLNFKL